jgi:ribokinase
MITVFGSINVDLVCRVRKAPMPGETVLGSDYALIPGGKGANQALAAARAGAPVRMVGAIGDDDIGKVALTELAPAGVELASVAERQGTTGVAIITVDDNGENTIVVSPGANATVDAGYIPADSFAAGDTLLLQLEVPQAQVFAAARMARENGTRVILSVAPFAPFTPEALADIDIVIVNEHEAADFARHFGLPHDDPEATVSGLAARLGRTVITTLGPEGAIAAGTEGVIRVPALTVTPVDTTGAGDTFAGVLAAYLDEGQGLRESMALAAIAGSLACTRHGAQPSFPTRAEIEAAATP